MCGIVGLFLKKDDLRPKLGDMLTDMLITMTDRGPDSAGIAIYGDAAEGSTKITVQSKAPETEFDGLEAALSAALDAPVTVTVVDTHAVLVVPEDKAAEAIAVLEDKGLRIMGSGASMEIYKEVGLPKDVAARFNLRAMGGSHGIGHTRMATESAVTTMGAHPFSTAEDQCLVHNGSLSNHNQMRRKLAKKGVFTRSENDTEVGAAYISSRIADGATLGEALEGTIDDLDGFFTFVTGTKNGFGVVRDPIACKPAVMAETEDYVAFASEYRAFADLPGIETAKVWEPEPATVYFWER
ncbi:glutamine amidotransferase family protein [Salipiger sp. P9]|uniref:class II glutamine amidotransferase n=1 Tax=Salipiger pentaromativorans TaxID=2943193 RepID=UPI0021571866|nr:glutamine amidotransferase family protein [Salipiger pentaromativorans]MCR8548933.1 glutamine amidotransferase family protein [Salipiger pentaromativorans]